MEHKICVLILSTTFVGNTSLSRNNRARYDKKCVLVLMYTNHNSCQILLKFYLSGQIFENNTQILFFLKIRRVGDELFHPDGQTDMTKLLVALCNFANAP
jgi:hypothetical protein